MGLLGRVLAARKKRRRMKITKREEMALDRLDLLRERLNPEPQVKEEPEPEEPQKKTPLKVPRREKKRRERLHLE